MELHTTKRCLYWSSPSHKLAVLHNSGTNIVLVLPQSERPTGDFVFTYTTERFEEPSLLSGRTDTGSCCLLSFIPNFSGLALADAERMALIGEDYQP